MARSTLTLAFLVGVLLVGSDLLRRSRAIRSGGRVDRVGGVSRPRLGLGVAGRSVGVGLVGGLLAFAAAPVPTLSLVAALACARVPICLDRRREEARRQARRRAWPEAVDLLASAVRAGETLPAALASLAERGPGPLRCDLGALVADHRLSGDLGGALVRMAAGLADPTADRFAVTLGFAYRSGGSGLGQVLRALALSLREDLALRAEIAARQSWVVVGARVAAAAPWAVLVIVMSRPSALEAYRSPAGAVVLIGGGAVTLAGFRAMLALGRVREEPRLLPDGASR
ncbi:MAG: type II secretion system F family protein [Acidimicrobiia bacterium]